MSRVTCGNQIQVLKSMHALLGRSLEGNRLQGAIPNEWSNMMSLVEVYDSPATVSAVYLRPESARRMKATGTLILSMLLMACIL